MVRCSMNQVTFSQKGVFRLEGYRLMQHGPSCPALEVSFDRKSGQYKARSQAEKNDKQKVAGGKFEMPADLYNGMALMLVKNLPGVPVRRCTWRSSRRNLA